MEVEFVVARDSNGKYTVYETILAQQSHDEILGVLESDEPAITEMESLGDVADYLKELADTE